MKTTPMKNLVPMILAAGLLHPGSLLAQIPSVINASFIQGNRASGVARGWTASIIAPAVGTATAARITITYVGQSKLTFQGIPQVLGSPDITLTSSGTP